MIADKIKLNYSRRLLINSERENILSPCWELCTDYIICTIHISWANFKCHKSGLTFVIRRKFWLSFPIEVFRTNNTINWIKLTQLYRKIKFFFLSIIQPIFYSFSFYLSLFPFHLFLKHIEFYPNHQLEVTAVRYVHSKSISVSQKLIKIISIQCILFYEQFMSPRVFVNVVDGLFAPNITPCFVRVLQSEIVVAVNLVRRGSCDQLKFPNWYNSMDCVPLKMAWDICALRRSGNYSVWIWKNYFEIASMHANIESSLF